MPDPTAAKYDYAEGLHKTLIFFESMRSGVLDRQRLAWCECLICTFGFRLGRNGHVEL